MNAISIFTGRHERQMVVDLKPILTERGKIKIGKLGDKRTSESGKQWQPPVKLDHFLVTTLARGADGNFVRDDRIHEILGDKPTEIPIRLIFDDPAMNFATRYVAFRGKSVWCQGNGEKAIRDGVPRECPCPNRERGYNVDRRGEGETGPRCKINGRLQVMIDNAASVGGVWVLRTTSWNTVQGIASSMALIQQVTAGRLSGVPLVLTVQPKQGHDEQGRPTTIYVVGIEYRGTIEQLREQAYDAAVADAKQGERYAHAIEDARRLLAAPVVSPDEETDVADEFYPEDDADEDALPAGPPVLNAAPPATVAYLYDLSGVEHEVPLLDADAWLASQLEGAPDRQTWQQLADNNPDHAARIMADCPFPAETPAPPPEPPKKPAKEPLRVFREDGSVASTVTLGSAWLESYRALLAKAGDREAVMRNNIETLRRLANQKPDMAQADLDVAEAYIGPSAEEVA